MGASIVSYGILHTMGNDWYSLQYSIVWEYVAKSILWGESGKLIAIFFPKYQWFSTIRSPSYGMLYRMGNAWVFPSISHSMGKSSKAHPMREKAWTQVLHRIKRCSRCVGDLRWWMFLAMAPVSSSTQVIAASIPWNSHHTVFYITWGMHGFSHEYFLT